MSTTTTSTTILLTTTSTTTTTTSSLSCEITTTIQTDCIDPVVYMLEQMVKAADNLPFSQNTYENALNRILDKGFVEDNCEFCCPDCGFLYAFSSVETFLKLMEGIGYTVGSACNSGEIRYVPCCNEDCFDKLKELIGANCFLNLQDKGFVEYSSIQDKALVCKFLDIVEKYNISPKQAYEILDRLLDKGITVSCDPNGQISIASVETWLKFAEAVGIACEV